MPEKGERSIAELVSELTKEVRVLFRQEMELFTVEIKEKSVHAVKDAAAIGVGGVLLYTGFLVLVAAIILALATVMPAWGAAFLVAALFVAVGVVLVQKGRKDLKRMEMKPEQTTESVRETVQWAKSLRSPSSSPRRTGFASKSGTRKAI